MAKLPGRQHLIPITYLQKHPEVLTIFIFHVFLREESTLAQKQGPVNGNTPTQHLAALKELKDRDLKTNLPMSSHRSLLEDLSP